VSADRDQGTRGQVFEGSGLPILERIAQIASIRSNALSAILRSVFHPIAQILNEFRLEDGASRCLRFLLAKFQPRCADCQQSRAGLVLECSTQGFQEAASIGRASAAGRQSSIRLESHRRRSGRHLLSPRRLMMTISRSWITSSSNFASLSRACV